MPELAVIHFIGVGVALLLSAVLYGLNAKSRRSEEMRRIQDNLRSVQLRWSDQQSRVLPYDEAAITAERASERRSAAVLTLLTAMASWLGVLVLLILILSMRMIARPRIEKRILASRLAEAAPLPPAEIHSIVRGLQN